MREGFIARVQRFCAPLIKVMALGFLIYGVFILEKLQWQAPHGFGFAIIGAILLFIAPKCDLNNRIVYFPKQELLAAAALACSAVWLLMRAQKIFQQPGESRPYYEEAVIALLLAGIVFVISFAFIDRVRSVEKLEFSGYDRALVVTFLLLALGLRGWQVVTRSPIDLTDEQEIFGDTLRLINGERPNPLGTTPLAFPWLYHWVVFLLRPLFDPVVDIWRFSKFIAAFAGSVSVAGWFAVMRLYSSRRVAAVAAMLISFSSWHWINSRFLYMYPFDLALVAITTYMACSALKTGSFWRASAAGVFSALTVITQKIAIMSVPFCVFLFMDEFMFGPKKRRGTVICLAAVWAISLGFMYYPSAEHYLNVTWLPRHTDILRLRHETLNSQGVTAFQAFFYLIGDAFYQLHVSAFDQARHMLRNGKGLLDPVLSVMFLVGLTGAFFSLRRDVVARMCIVGFFLFAMPMVISFPVDSVGFHGLPRRMLACILFVCWLGARGAESLFQRFVYDRKVGIGMFCAAILSACMNVLYVFADYMPPGRGFRFLDLHDIGVQKASMLAIVRDLARNGIPVLVLGDSPDLTFRLAVHELRNVKVHKQVSELRDSILSNKGALVYVVVPGNDLLITGGYQMAPHDLADIIPPYLWINDGINIHHNPTVRYALIRAPG